MAWTTPRTWVAGEALTAALLNTHVRDNLNFLKGAAGTVTFDDVIKFSLNRQGGSTSPWVNNGTNNYTETSCFFQGGSIQVTITTTQMSNYATVAPLITLTSGTALGTATMPTPANGVVPYLAVGGSTYLQVGIYQASTTNPVAGTYTVEWLVIGK